jgi:hypothetical protein
VGTPHHGSTEYSRGVGRLISLAYSSCGLMEIGGPLASTILLQGEAVTFRCDFSRLVLVEGLNMLDKIEVEAMVVSKHNQLYTETTIGIYIERPDCLEQFSWYDFSSWIGKVESAPPRIRCSCTFNAQSAEGLRDHLKQHSMVTWHTRVSQI